MALVWGAATGAAAAVLVGVPTLRLHGLYFAVATLAFAEMVRILFELFRLSGPDRRRAGRARTAPTDSATSAISSTTISTPLQFLLLIYALLAAALFGVLLMERSRLGVDLSHDRRGRDLAATAGHLAWRGYKVLAAGLAGALAGVGGGLYAHLTTYIEPRIFDVMLGVHSLAYGLIGGLGTAFGPLLGVLIDIGLLESIAAFWPAIA